MQIKLSTSPSPSADPSHLSANFLVTSMTRPRKKSRRKRDSNPGSSALEADALPLGQRGGEEKEVSGVKEDKPPSELAALHFLPIVDAEG